MRAVYLQSVVSPKLANRINHRSHRAPVVLSDTDEQSEDFEEVSIYCQFVIWKGMYIMVY